MKKLLTLLSFAVSALFSCAQKTPVLQQQKNTDMTNDSLKKENVSSIEIATFANGCFWCTEAIFEQLDGVISAVSGYTGGQTPNPTYKEVCTGETGHAECLQITYNPSKISFDELLEIFWQTHDPTTLNRQGADIGTQYRSAIFYHNNEQKEKAEEYKA